MAPHHILLTGANGFIASHILSNLLEAKHSVRAVVRSQSKVDSLKSLFPAPASQLDYAIIPDMTAPGAFDEALKSNPPFDIVMHTASPFLYKAAEDVNSFLQPAIKGTTEVLEGIQHVAKDSVKRVILTSSFAAIASFGRTDETNKVYTEADWNPVTLEQTIAEKSLGVAYSASKTLAEKAAWEIAKRDDVKWQLATINPPMVYGPLAHKVEKMEDLNESTARIYNGFLKTGAEMPPNAVHLYIDVRDVARAHVLAMDAVDAGNKRFLITPGAVTSQEISDILRAKVPGAEERTPKGEPGKNTLPDDAYKADTSRAQKVLGLTYRSKEDTFVDLGKQLLEIEKSAK